MLGKAISMALSKRMHVSFQLSRPRLFNLKLIIIY